MRQDCVLAVAMVSALACGDVANRPDSAGQQSRLTASAAVDPHAPTRDSASIGLTTRDTIWLGYEPRVVQLTGVVDTLIRFGAPNYGETPGTDAQLIVPILHLETPISVPADRRSATNDEEVLAATTVQLVLPPGGMTLPIVGSRILVSGTLSHAISGHHYTQLLLSVSRLQEAD
jgi:hypothetical protein